MARRSTHLICSTMHWSPQAALRDVLPFFEGSTNLSGVSAVHAADFLRSADCNVAQDTALVVDHVAVAATDALGLFDDPVEHFGAGVGHVVGERDQDRRPPGLDGCREPCGFGHGGVEAAA